MKTKLFSAMIILILFLVLYRYCDKTTESIPDSAKRVLHAMLECPNEDLYKPSTTVIGIDIDPSETDNESIQASIDAEKDAWKKAIGDCFASNMFDTFFQQWDRIHCLGYAYACNLTITIHDMTVLTQNDNIQHILVTIDVTKADADSPSEPFELEWRIIYDKNEPKLLQSVKLIDDDNLWGSFH